MHSSSARTPNDGRSRAQRRAGFRPPPRPLLPPPPSRCRPRRRGRLARRISRSRVNGRTSTSARRTTASTCKRRDASERLFSSSTFRTRRRACRSTRCSPPLCRPPPSGTPRFVRSHDPCCRAAEELVASAEACRCLRPRVSRGLSRDRGAPPHLLRRCGCSRRPARGLSELLDRGDRGGSARAKRSPGPPATVRNRRGRRRQRAARDGRHLELRWRGRPISSTKPVTSSGSPTSTTSAGRSPRGHAISAAGSP